MRVGLWSLAHLHARSYVSVLRRHPEVEWVGLTDEDPARGAHMAQEYGLPFVAEPGELLARVHAVIITSANADHKAMALQAAEAGVHALVEKPIATTLADALAIVSAFERAGLVLGTAFPCPFSPAFGALRDAVASGSLGKPLAAKTTNRGKMPGGFFIELERSGGGAVIDHTVHVADLLRRLMPSPATQVHAEIGRGLFHETWDDSGILTIDYADGAFATLDCSWSRPTSYPTWGDVTLRLIGERGNAEADLFGQHVTRYPADQSPPAWHPWGSDLDELMIHDFVAAVRDRRPPRSTGRDGLAALQIALAAYESSRQRRPVAVTAGA
ncbi:MAG: Gfo/Idh/MocA family oxidoreductase [Chloroflexi bacterium]|nr:Gfo/Idh/MocA family oxidoreductase [Chloroflexota bacterium]